MYDERELTVEQIGTALGVSRTSIYRALGKTTTPALPSAPAPAELTGPVGPAAGKRQAKVVAPAAALPTQGPGGAPPPAVRGRSRWFVVQAAPADPERGVVVVVVVVVVLSGHTSQQARRRRLAGPGAGQRPGWGRGRCCRSGTPSRSVLGWGGTARPGGALCTPGRHRDHPAGRGAPGPVVVDVSGLLSEPAATPSCSRGQRNALAGVFAALPGVSGS